MHASFHGVGRAAVNERPWFLPSHAPWIGLRLTPCRSILLSRAPLHEVLRSHTV